MQIIGQHEGSEPLALGEAQGVAGEAPSFTGSAGEERWQRGQVEPQSAQVRATRRLDTTRVGCTLLDQTPQNVYELNVGRLP